ncbi:uncharacterized protein LOC144656357 [Oculina patagonica]
MELNTFPLSNIVNSRFYLPSSTDVPAVLPYSLYYGGYISPDMSFFYPRQDIRVLPSYMGHHSAFQGIPHHFTEEEKPTQSYIGLIGKAILSSPQQKLVLGDIYNYILTNYPYFRNKGPGWRNSIRHNLSLNDCFVKMGRSPNGKGHFWAINPINYDDFSRGEYKRKRASRRNRERKQDQMKTSEMFTAHEIPCNTNIISNGLEKRGFHIETLLSNKWEEINSNETHNTMSAFTVVYPGLLSATNKVKIL